MTKTITLKVWRFGVTHAHWCCDLFSQY